MIKTKTVLREETVVDTCLCNKCGADMDTQPELHKYNGLVNFKVTGGYFSPHLQDMTEYRFDLCEKCLVELFAQFIIPVEEKDLLDHGSV